MSRAQRDLYRNNDETKIALIEQGNVYLKENLIKIERSLEKHDDEFRKIHQESTTNFRWLIGIMITLFSGLYATVGGILITHFFHLV